MQPQVKILRNACYVHPRRWTSAPNRPTQKITTQRARKKREKKKAQINNMPKAIQTHIYTVFLSFFLILSPVFLTHTDTVLSVSKQVFLSITQTAPSCVCQCCVKLLNSGTTSLVFTEMHYYVSVHCQRDRD